MSERAANARPAKPAVRGRRTERRQIDGILLLDKPVGMTSNAALQMVKRRFGARKAGHTGSLDPLASGMLPLCFGHATKVSAYLLEADKEYVVTARFGARTDTADADGTVVETAAVDRVERDRFEAAMVGLRGEIEQVPPMYSALKQNGKRLYELARRGEVVERAPRPVTIYALEIEHWDAVEPVLRVRCSKGTYVRTLVEDLARAAGTLGHVAALRRTRVEPFPADGLVPMAEVERAAESGAPAIDALLRPIDSALAGWPSVHLNNDQAYYLMRGNPVHARSGDVPGLVRVYGENERFLGIADVLGDGRIAPKRLFVD